MKKALLIVMIVALAGCASPGKRSWFAKWMVPVNTSYLQVGMTESTVRDLCRFPDKINRTTTENIVHEQWVYDNGYSITYLYFDNGILTGWQD